MVNISKKQICPVCESRNVKHILNANDYLVSGESFEIIECSNCTLRFTSPVPSLSNMDKYYRSDEYISHAEQGKTIIYRIYKIVQRISLIRKKYIIEKTNDNLKGKLLDIGCGTGDFLYKMKKSGWVVTGVEANDTARNIAQKLINQNIHSSIQYFEDEDKYDVITLWHSLEHLHNLKEYIEKIIKSLNQNGILIIAVPNYRAIEANYYKEHWAAYDVPRHLYHFSPQAIKELFSKYGFDIKYKQLPFDPFYISLLSEYSVIKSNNLIRAVWIGSRSYLKGMFNPEKGSSIMYILKRINN